MKHPLARSICVVGDFYLFLRVGRLNGCAKQSSRECLTSQKAESSTVSSAMSHSVPMANTLATNFWSSPRLLTLTWSNHISYCSAHTAWSESNLYASLMKPYMRTYAYPVL